MIRFYIQFKVKRYGIMPFVDMIQVSCLPVNAAMLGQPRPLLGLHRWKKTPDWQMGGQLRYQVQITRPPIQPSHLPGDQRPL